MVRDRAPERTLPHVAPLGVRGDARSARRAVPVRRVRRTASAGGLGPRSGHAHRAPRRPAHRRDERRHDPGSRPVRRLRGGRVAERPRRRARRGDGLRVPRERRLHARYDELADRRDHPRPGERAAGVRPAGQGPVLARRRHRSSRGARRGTRPVLPRGVIGGSGQGPAAPDGGGPRRTRAGQPPGLPGGADRGDRIGAERPPADGGTQPRRGRRLARHPAFPVRHAGALPVGSGRERPDPRATRGRGIRGRQRRRHHRPHPRCHGRSAGRRAVRVRRGRARTDRHRRGGRLRPVRVTVPGVRGPRPAHAPHEPEPAEPALAAAAALGPAPGGRATPPDLPDHPRDAPRGAAGRLSSRRRRPSPRRSRGTCCSATSARSCTRATRPSPNAVPRLCRSTPACCRSCSARSRCASCSTPRSSSSSNARRSASTPTAG
ncbi:MAG: ATP-dependent helicase lhr [Microbacterium sp.]|nr:ATP-dependent helicase lhr [Microbacterium sp.]